jgi:hypothetical protein
MENKGIATENRFRKYLETDGQTTKTFKLFDNSEISFSYNCTRDGGSSNTWKADVQLAQSSEYNTIKIVGLSVKTTKGNRASILNYATMENIGKCEVRTGINMSPVKAVYQYLVENQKSGVYLSEFSDISEWSDILTYFMFDGTPKRNCEYYEKAEYLVDIPVDAVSMEQAVLVPKEQAVEHAWKSFKAELKSNKKGELGLVIRYAK